MRVEVTTSKRTRLAMLLVLACASSLWASSALAAPWADPRLDAVSSEVAGRPVTVRCETDESAWQTILAQWGFPNLGGFADIPRSTNYLSADTCIYVKDALESGPGALGAFHGSALLTLLHEAVHQRAGTFNCSASPDALCEGHTDCAALALIPKYVESFFGIHRTVTETWTEYRYKRVRVRIKGKLRWVRRRVAVRRSRELENEVYNAVVAGAERAHRTLPPPYNISCS